MIYIKVKDSCKHCGGSFESHWQRLTCPLCKEIL